MVDQKEKKKTTYPKQILPRLVEAAVVHVCVECGPVLSVLGHLEHPVAQGGAAVAAGVAERVGRGDDPQAQVHGEPGILVVVGVAVQRRAVAAQDVFQPPVRKIPALR